MTNTSPKMLVAEVIVDVPSSNINRPFDYLVPVELQDRIRVGSRVLVPFGSRKVGGYVLGFTANPHAESLKSIISIYDDKVPVREELIKLARWIAEKYLCLYIYALRSVLPLGGGASLVRAKEIPSVSLNIPPDEARKMLDDMRQRAPLQALVLEALVGACGHQLPLAKIFGGRRVAYSSVRALVERGLISTGTIRLRRDPLSGHNYPPTSAHELDRAQERALSAITDKIARSDPKPLLLHGVTGSGKTEVYLRAIEYAMRLGKDAILLVPEISLTPQMVRMLSSRFGREVAIIHSRLSRGERHDELERIARGEVRVAVGARSAVFAPFSNLGLMILDEEHENSYKQGESPRYHARDVAAKRAALEGASLVLGSATPSLESYYRAMAGEYDYVTLPSRIDGRPMPRVEIVDMRGELASGNKSIFSRALVEAVRERLGRREQVILFLNRRGYSTFALCRECGFVLKCKRCDVSLTYHADSRRMVCHYCNFEVRVPDVCPKCKSTYMRYFGAGTERVEAEARKAFEGARVVRMDTDTTRNKGAHERILSAFGRGEYDILVGTQMIAKGLDFPNVTLVGIVAADTLLNLPDFRAGERTFQLLCQVAGRAGRGKLPGEVILQTYAPDHYAITAAARGDYEGFYRSELGLRRELGYPPFTSITRLLMTSADEGLVGRAAMQAASAIKRGVAGLEEGSFSVLGPSPCAIKKVAGRFRWHIIIKSQNPDETNRMITESMRGIAREFEKTDLEFLYDVDPESLL